MICHKCNFENKKSSAFCSNCGDKLIPIKEENYKLPIKNISIFFFALLVYIIILNFTQFMDSYTSILIADSLFALIVITFFLLNLRSTLRLFHFKKNSLKIIIFIFILVPVFALIIHYFVNFINQSAFNSSGEIYYNQYKDSPAPLFFSIISIGLFPAVFEEIAFRGILFNQSLQIMRIKPTILITSILFTILHLSLLSALWLFPIGLVLGYLRAKHRTIIYGIILHFVYNTSIVIFQILLK